MQPEKMLTGAWVFLRIQDHDDWDQAQGSGIRIRGIIIWALRILNLQTQEFVHTSISERIG